MKRISIIGLIIALLAPLALWAQAPSINVLTKRQVSVGEQFKIAFEVNAEGRSFSAPAFDGFTLVGGPFNSTSSNVQIVNGNMTRSVSNTYSYVLRAEREGEFTIGSASIVVDGNVVKSEPCKITVTEGASDSGAAQGGGSGQVRQSTNDPQVSGQDLFLKVIPAKRSAYVGEPVVLTYKLYTRVPVSQISVSKMPSYGGFWMKECGDNNGNTLRQSSEVINGIEYTTAEVKKVVVIPQKAGKLTIEPMALECIAQIVTQRAPQYSNDPFDAFFNDPFFSRSYSNVQKNIETATVTMDVKALPEDGKPASFAGAVGNYNFSATIDRNEAVTNEALTVTVTVSGSGNLELLNLPAPVFPPDFEVYDPKVTSSVDANSQGMNGTRKAEYLVIPRRPGDFTIPMVEFSYFNPAKDIRLCTLSNVDKTRNWSMSESYSQYKFNSIFSRLSYDYAGKYYLDASFRRTTYPPSGSISWRSAPLMRMGWPLTNSCAFLISTRRKPTFTGMTSMGSPVCCWTLMGFLIPFSLTEETLVE